MAKTVAIPGIISFHFFICLLVSSTTLAVPVGKGVTGVIGIKVKASKAGRAISKAVTVLSPILTVKSIFLKNYKCYLKPLLVYFLTLLFFVILEDFLDI